MDLRATLRAIRIWAICVSPAAQSNAQRYGIAVLASGALAAALGEAPVVLVVAVAAAPYPPWACALVTWRRGLPLHDRIVEVLHRAAIRRCHHDRGHRSTAPDGSPRCALPSV